MDLLETVLRSAGFEEFENIFRDNGIESYTLKILNDQDLRLLGIENNDKRQHLLKVIHNLQIPSEKKITIRVDKSYALLVLSHVSLHLQKQFANLTYILKREDVDICDIQLTPAVATLENVLNSMQAKLHMFEYKVLKVPRKKNREKYIIPSLIVTSATLFIFCRYLLL